MEKTFTYDPKAEYPWQYRYEHMAVTNDCVIFTYDDWKLKVLLVRRGGEPYKGEWAFPGGFLQNTETAEQGALRELLEETSLIPSSPIVQFGVFSDPRRDPRERVITIAWYALVKPSEVLGGDDAEEAAWFPVEELPPLAFDHREIFTAAMERLRRDIHFQPVGFDLLDEEFTIPDLQRLYEAILGVKFDRRNFQRKILASGVLEEADRDSGIRFSVSSTRLSPRDAVHAMVDLEEPAIPDYMDMMCEGAPAESAMPRKQRPGRTGSFWTFNRKKYEELKEGEGKTEF